MSKADELLNTLDSDDISTYTADPESEPHIVIDKDRNIIVPDKLKRIAVQNDNNIETVIFDCPRYWDEHDLSEMAIYINYIRKDGEPGSYLADNISVDESDPSIFHFSWTIQKHTTIVAGNLQLLVCAKTTDEDGNEQHHWNSELNTSLYVSAGMKCSESPILKYPDIVTQLLTRMSAAEKTVNDGMFPTINVEETEDGTAYIITITDVNGERTVTLMQGKSGKSAYSYAKEAGYTGDEAAFAKKLAQAIPTKPSDIGAQKLLYFGLNPTSGEEDDTFEKWVALGTGYAFYSEDNLLHNQVSRYGFLLNITMPSNVSQLWFSLPNGAMYHRSGNTGGLSTTWARVYDSVTKPTTTEIGAAEASTHNIKTYTNLTQLGLSNGATMSQVARALPGSSILKMYIITSENANLAPVATNGWLEVNRPNANHVEFRYVSSSKKVYCTEILNVGNDEKEQVGEWIELANKNDIPTTASDVKAAPETHKHSADDINSGTFPVLRGGTGATERASATQNLLFIGVNPLSSASEDTVDKWAAFKTGHAWFNVNGLVTDQPAQYGMLFNLAYEHELFQIWKSPDNGIYVRSGNYSGWKHTWAKVYDSRNKPTPTEIGAAASTHKHTKSDISDFPTSMTPTAHTHTKSQITDFPTSMTPTAHNHTKSDITDFPTTETWTFTLEDGSTVTKAVYVG